MKRGPVASFLRSAPERDEFYALLGYVPAGDPRETAWTLLVKACCNLGYEVSDDALAARAWPDVLSEAIEAAEALGL